MYEDEDIIDEIVPQEFRTVPEISEDEGAKNETEEEEGNKIQKKEKKKNDGNQKKLNRRQKRKKKKSEVIYLADKFVMLRQ